MDKNDHKVYSDDYGIKLKNKKELIFNFFKFIEEKDPEYKIPFKLKLTVAPESITPDDLNIGGDLDLYAEDITSLPSGLKVNGKLDLSYTNISELPKDLKVGRWLDITSTPLAEKYLEKYKSNIFGSQKNKIKKAFKKDYPNLLGEEGYLVISNWDGD